MKFTVLWKQQAEDQLAEIWLASDRSPEVTVAADELEKILRNDAQNQGESRSDSRRVVFIPPLVVAFRVNEDDRVVWVLSVHAK